MWKLFSVWGTRLASILFVAALISGCGGMAFSTPEPVELTFVYLNNAADYQPLAEEFHRQNENITIHLKAASDYGSLVRELALESGGADALRLPTTAISAELTQAFLPLDSMLSTGEMLDPDDLFTGSLEALRLDGKQVGLPAGINPFVMYYLPQKLEAAGVQVPPPNWTMEEFVITAAAINNPDDALIGTPRYTYGFCSHPQLTDIALITYLFGGGLFDSLVQTTRPVLNSPANVEALAWYASLRDDLGLLPNRPNAREVGALVYRLSCGFWMDWLDKSTFGAEGAVQAEPLPLPRHRMEFNVATQDGYFVMTKSEHPEEAYQWIRFLIEQESASGNLIPPLHSTVESAAYAARSPQGILSVARTLPAQTVIFSMDMLRDQRMGRTIELFSSAALSVFNGKADPQSALDSAQQQAEDLFR